MIYRNQRTGSEAELYRYLAKAVAKHERRECACFAVKEDCFSACLMI
ncbi:MAG: hypothetical protein RLO21_19615 [Nitratireductor sp.]